MGNGLKVFIVLLIVAAIIFGVGFKVQKETRREALKKLGEYKKTLDTVIDDMENDQSVKRLSAHPQDYLKGVLSVMETPGFLGLTAVFDEKMKAEFYDRFITETLRFREVLIRHDPSKTLSNKSKKGVMSKVVYGCEELLIKTLAPDGKGIKENAILKKWMAVDRKTFFINDKDFPEPEEDEEEEETGFSKEIAKFEVNRGKQVEKTRAVPMNVSTKVTVGYDQLRNYIGAEIEALLKSGQTYTGLLKKVDRQALELEIYVEGGTFSKKLPRQDIQKLERISYKKVEGVVVHEPVRKRKEEQPVKKTKAEAAAASPGQYQDLLLHPGSFEKKYEQYCFVTKDYKMYVISDWKGSLVTHTRETPDGFKPMATRIDPKTIKANYLLARNAQGSEGRYRITYFEYIFADKKKMSRYNFEFVRFEPFRITFNVKLVKKATGSESDIEIKQERIELTDKNVIFISRATALDVAMSEWGNARYGKGNKPWEFEAAMGLKKK